MSATVCVFARALYYPETGGVLWEYLNWSLGLRSLNCPVIWMEAVYPDTKGDELRELVASLKQRLERYGLSDSVALCSTDGEPLAANLVDGCMDVETAAEADLLLTMGYGVPAEVVKRFRRSAMVDVDPGLTQIWMSEGQLSIAKHDLYFTTGETVGQPGSLVPDVGLEWHYTPPSVALDWWPVCTPLESNAPFSTISQWYGDEWVKQAGETYYNDKREGFRHFLDLPKRTSQPLELALAAISHSLAEEE
jgi:hypothetical protein